MDKIKVLVIDDEQGIRDLFIQALDEDDYEVLTVDNGEQGLDIIKSEKPSVIFLDLKLPGIDGLEVLKCISDLEIKPIVIMITGHGTIAKAAKTMDLGAYDYIVKPFQIDDIIKLMKQALKMDQLEQNVSSFRDQLKKKEGDQELS